MSVDKNSKDEEKMEKPIVAKSAVDLQRLKLQKLMKNPDKPVLLPERPKSKNTPTVPEFVRNVMGSSAGAGSGEFHVYRHLRRKEYSRQKFIQEKGHKELLDEEYHRKLEENRKLAEEMTAKKRAKRLKRKMKQKGKKRVRKDSEDTKDKGSEEEEDEDEDEGKSASEEEIPDKNETPPSEKDVEAEDRGKFDSGHGIERTRGEEARNKGSEEDSGAKKNSDPKDILENENKINSNKNEEDSDKRGKKKSESEDSTGNFLKGNDIEEDRNLGRDEKPEET